MRSLVPHFFIFAFRIFIIVLLLFSTSYPTLAASLTATSLTLSNTEASSSNVTYTLQATIPTTDNIKQISLQFSTVSAGTTKPTGLDLNDATLTSTSNLGSGWNLNKTAVGSGLLTLDNAIAQSISSSTEIQIVLGAITNHAIDDCETEANGLVDRCWLRVVTYSDDGSTEVDSANIPFIVTEEPFLNFSITGTGSSAIHNGITTTVASTRSSLPFGTLAPGIPQFAAHQLDIATNAPGGYTVTAQLENLIEGSYHNADFEPFAGVDATWTTPQFWSTPDGTTPGNHTGWFGANTSDTRLAGWGGGSGKFAPLGTLPRPVAYSSGPDRNGSVIYVSYGIEVNQLHPADLYTGRILYSVQPNY